MNENFTLKELINNGYELSELKKLGITPIEFYNNNVTFYEMFTQLGYTYGELEDLYKINNKLLKNGNIDNNFNNIIKNCKKLFTMQSNCKYDSTNKNQVIILNGGNVKSRRIIKKLNKKKSIRNKIE